jgi:hypothetical protein
MEEINTTRQVAPKESALATLSLMLGILGIPLCLLVIPALLAIIFGIIALVKCNRSAGVLKGKGKAVAGIILGGISLILVVLILIIGASVTNRTISQLLSQILFGK